ncbi:MAG: hypothetical protein HY878_06760 [Deltaproteobacteria bacterium]|nr:hypothetical protein [Deltaproteobacteria bacterium]
MKAGLYNKPEGVYVTEEPVEKRTGLPEREKDEVVKKPAEIDEEMPSLEKRLDDIILEYLSMEEKE